MVPGLGFLPSISLLPPFLQISIADQFSRHDRFVWMLREWSVRVGQVLLHLTTLDPCVVEKPVIEILIGEVGVNLHSNSADAISPPKERE
jgi:hypothetical protein